MGSKRPKYRMNNRSVLSADLSDGKTWRKFVDLAFDISDHFSLKNYHMDISAAEEKEYYRLTRQLEEFIETDIPEKLPHSVFGEYDIAYFRCVYPARVLIKEVPDITKFRFPHYPEDICFFRNGRLWFGSITADHKFSYAEYRIENIEPEMIKILEKL